MEITAELFKKYTGCDSENDDLERCNCDKVGKLGHDCCGWDKARNMLVFIPGESKG